MPFRKAPRFLVLTVAYSAIVNLAYLAALALRFEGQVPARFWQGYLEIAPAFTLLSLLGFFLAGLYHGLWRYASTVTLFQIFKGVTLSALTLVVLLFLLPERKFPTSLIVIVWLVELVIVGGVRFAWRLARERVLGTFTGHSIPTLVIGAEHTGVDLVQEMRRRYSSAEESLMPVGFLDDDERLTGHLIEGLKVFGTVADLPARAARPPHRDGRGLGSGHSRARAARDRRACAPRRACASRRCPASRTSVTARGPRSSQMRDIRIEDLLGREPVQLDLEEVGGFLRGQRVLVTGGGGSIGSELARQVCELRARRTGAARSRRERPVLRASASWSRPRPPSRCTPSSATSATRRASKRVFRALPARGRASTRRRTSTCRCSRRARARRC